MAFSPSHPQRVRWNPKFDESDDPKRPYKRDLSSREPPSAASSSRGATHIIDAEDPFLFEVMSVRPSTIFDSLRYALSLSPLDGHYKRLQKCGLIIQNLEQRDVAGLNALTATNLLSLADKELVVDSEQDEWVAAVQKVSKILTTRYSKSHVLDPQSFVSTARSVGRVITDVERFKKEVPKIFMGGTPVTDEEISKFLRDAGTALNKAWDGSDRRSL